MNSQNLLASGAADGECLVWDLTDLSKPANFKVVSLPLRPRQLICSDGMAVCSPTFDSSGSYGS